MERKSVGFELDPTSRRVVLPTSRPATARSASCTLPGGVPGRFKDYISSEQNDYRSIQHHVIGPGKQRVECRSVRGNDQIAEFGIAVHALYKTASARPNRTLEAESTLCLLRTRRILSKAPNPEEFLEHTSRTVTIRCLLSRPRAN